MSDPKSGEPQSPSIADLQNELDKILAAFDKCESVDALDRAFAIIGRLQEAIAIIRTRLR
jgi:hypothetical protein